MFLPWWCGGWQSIFRRCSCEVKSAPCMALAEVAVSRPGLVFWLSGRSALLLTVYRPSLFRSSFRCVISTSSANFTKMFASNDQIYKMGQKFGAALPTTICRPRNMGTSARLRTTHHHHERAPGWSVAVSTSCLHRSLSWASRHAMLRP